MLHQTAMQQYKSTHVETGSAEKLIVLLYEGALRFCGEAHRAMVADDIPARSRSLTRAKRIVQELNNALDHEVGGEIAARLAALYEFVEHRLTLANLDHDRQAVADAQHILRILLESWERVARGEGESTAAEDLPAVPAPTPGRSSLSVSC